MWRCRPVSSSRSEASRRSIAAGALCRPKPNLVFGPPVEIDGCVSGLMPGATRSWTRRVAHDPQDRGARERLGGEVDLEVLAALGVGGLEGARARADVVLGDDVGG